ncbi:MAG: protein kinase [Gammaproteobacteria bacterium]|jgi:tetratricopeptide (TPR) repeat protein/TolB-like protein|nr:protein kinase [Gammaproteobacteria bacterium]
MTDRRQSSEDHTRTMDGTGTVLMPGTVLNDRYQIIEVVGAGGMGIVYRAHDRQLKVDVAVKMLTTGRVPDAKSLARFRDEILLARQVSHPNVVRIHDIGIDGEMVYLTMDYVVARTLRERLSEQGALNQELAVDIAIQLGQALAAAHKQDIVHRDIKPSNILVNDRGHACLMDFGIARSMGKQGLTRQGEIVGTLEYLAPEQVRGDAVDNRTDIYALGLVLWEMLSGEIVLTGETDEETMARHAIGRLPTTFPGAGAVPTYLCSIVRRCLCADPDDRYQDAETLVADLQQGHASGKPRHQRRHYIAGIVIVFAAVGLFMGLGQFWDTGDTLDGDMANSDAVSVAQRLAVFPIANDTGNQELDWVRRGLSESIANDLADAPEIGVTESLRVIRALADLRLDSTVLTDDRLRELGELFAADIIVLGKLLGSGPEYRLELRLLYRSSPDSRRFQIEVSPKTILDGSSILVGRILKNLQVDVPSAGHSLPLSDNIQALTAYDQGVGALANGNYSDAIEQLESAVDLDADFGAAWLHLSNAFQLSGLYDKAINASSRAMSMFVDASGRMAMQARARHAALSGDTQRAVEMARELVRKFPEQAEAKLLLGELLGDVGQLDQARDTLLDVTQIDPSLARAWFLLGKYAIMAGDANTAVNEYLVRALILQNKLDNPAGQGEVLNALGIAHERLGKLEAAKDYYTQSLLLRKAAADSRGQSASMSNLARLNMISGDYDQAREALEQALVLREEIEDLPGVAALRIDFGVLEEEVGRYIIALQQYREALRIYEEVGDAVGVTNAQTNLAFIYLLLGQYDNAAVFIDQVLRKYRDSGNDQGLMAALQISGELQIARGRWEQASTNLLEAFNIARKIDNPFGQATIQGSIATLAWYQGRIKAALEAFHTAIAILEPLQDTRGLAEYHLLIAEMMADLRLTESAGKELTQAKGYLGGMENLSQRVRVLLVSGALASQNGQPEIAAEFISTASSFSEEIGSTLTKLSVELARVRWLQSTIADANELLATATQLGHRHFRLLSLNFLAAAQLQIGQVESALETLRTAQRPTVVLQPWVHAWRLRATNAQALRLSDQQGGQQMLLEAKALYHELSNGMPIELSEELSEPAELLVDD